MDVGLGGPVRSKVKVPLMGGPSTTFGGVIGGVVTLPRWGSGGSISLPRVALWHCN